MTLQFLDSLCDHLDREIIAHYLHLNEESAKELTLIAESGNGVYFDRPPIYNHDDYSIIKYRGFTFLIPTVK